jgi:hypothetical protein
VKEEFYQRLTEDIVLQWLDFTKATTLLLVTGWIKSRTWGVAAMSNSSSSASLMFRTIKADGQVSGSYCWESSSPGQCRVGPWMPSDRPNQCVFLRGFKLSSRKSLGLTRNGNTKVVLTDIRSGKMMECMEDAVTPSQNPQPSGSGVSSRSPQGQDTPAEAEALDSDAPNFDETNYKTFFEPRGEMTQVPISPLCTILLFIFMITVLPSVGCHK